MGLPASPAKPCAQNRHQTDPLKNKSNNILLLLTMLLAARSLWLKPNSLQWSSTDHLHHSSAISSLSMSPTTLPPAHSTLALPASSECQDHTKHSPTAGPWLQLYPLPGIPFQIFTQLTSWCPSDLCSKATMPRKPSLMLYFKLRLPHLLHPVSFSQLLFPVFVFLHRTFHSLTY